MFAVPSEDVTERSGVRWPFWEQADQSRRWLGEMVEALGFGPVETPSRILLAEGPLRLKGYGDAAEGAPTVLLLPAPIKRAYLWDLDPASSVVRRCLDAGMRVYLIQWEPPGADEESLGLPEYADCLILDCLRAIEAEGGQPQLFLAGHSLGGTLAAIFAALHPDMVRGLVLLGAPLHFGPDVGALDRLVAVSPPVHPVAAALGNVPGSVLDVAAFLAAPITFGWSRWTDWMASLPDARARETYLRVERWTLDELRLPRRLFEEVVELLYREDRLMRGGLPIRERRATPELVHAPLLSVVDAGCSIVPPQAVLPFHQAARSAEKRLLWYGGDIGVSLRHVGLLVGRSAHARLWPEILAWIGRQTARG